MSIDGLPNLQRWLKTMNERPGVQKGMEIPEPTDVAKLLAESDEKEAGGQLVKAGRSMLVGADEK